MQKKIELTRELMINTALVKGLNARETIEISRNLDALMNQYDTFVSQEREEVDLQMRERK